MKVKINYFILILILGIAIISVSLNFYLLHFSIEQYRNHLTVKLNPDPVIQFHPSNQSYIKKHSNKTRVILFGDSRISHWKTLPDNDQVNFINRGHSGDTTAQLLLRINRDVISLQPDIVIVQAGINDLKVIGVSEDNSDHIIMQCRNNLEKIIQSLTSKNIEVVILTIFPTGQTPIIRRPVWSNLITNAINNINHGLLKTKNNNVITLDVDKIFLDKDTGNIKKKIFERYVTYK